MLRQISEICVLPRKAINKFNMSGDTVHIETIPGKNWVQIKFTIGTAKFQEKGKTSEAGISYQQSLKCNFCKRTDSDEYRLKMIENTDIVVKIKYNDGQTEAIGCPEFWARLITDMNVSTSTIYNLEFSCDTIFRAFRLLN